MKTSRSPNRVSLPRALSKLGFASRTTANKLIADGSVLVNGHVELNPHRWVNLQSDRIAVAGTELVKTERRYVILNKPPGVVTTASDERGRTTVMDLLGEEGTGIAPVGRLDKETSGLILLTNDNELANFLTSPESGLPKTYAVVVDKKVDREDLSRLRQGISITVNGQEYWTRPAETRLMDRHAVELTITEGKNRQVRKMFEELGYQIVRLHRLSVGPLQIGTLREGEFRLLTPGEIALLTAWKKPKRPAVFAGGTFHRKKAERPSDSPGGTFHRKKAERPSDSPGGTFHRKKAERPSDSPGGTFHRKKAERPSDSPGGTTHRKKLKRPSVSGRETFHRKNPHARRR